MTLLLVSFLAGILTVLAPCVLPVLPVILAGSLSEKQKWYPYLVTFSLALSVVLFTVILKVSTAFIDIPSSFWKYLSWGILLTLGLVYIFPHGWAWIAEKAKFSRSNASLDTAQNIGNPVLRAVVTGAVLGPVFSTCSPTYSLLLATVFPVSVALGIGYTLVYAFGLSCMLTLIALGGRSLVSRFRGIADERWVFKKILGIVFFLVWVAIITGFDKTLETKLIEKFDISRIEQSLLDSTVTQEKSESVSSTWSQKTASWDIMLNVKNPYLAPEIALTEWINSHPLTMQSLRGKVVIIDFWTYSCINCQRTLPYLVKWDKKYRDKWLVIIGVHAPEFSFEKKRENVENATKDADISYPVVLDNDFSLWSAYNNHYWPAKYFIDKEGKVRHTHFGEWAYAESEKVIQQLLSEWSDTGLDIPVDADVILSWKQSQSPETYLGMARRANFVEGNNLKPNEWSLSGKWESKAESIRAEKNAHLDFSFQAKDVYLVLGWSGTVTVTVDKKLQFPWTDVKDGKIILSGDRMYHLVHSDASFQGILGLDFSPGVEAFAFTFGS